MSLGIRKFRRAVDFDDFRRHPRNRLAHARCRGYQIRPNSRSSRSCTIPCAEGPEAAAKTEAQRHGIFRSVKKTRRRSIAICRARRAAVHIIGKHGKQPAKTIGLMASIPAAPCRALASVTVSPMRAIGHALMLRRQNRHPASSSSSAMGFGVSVPSCYLVNLVVVDEANFIVIRDAPFHHATRRGTAVNVEPRIEISACSGFSGCLGGGTRATMASSRPPCRAAFGADQQCVLRRNREHRSIFLLRNPAVARANLFVDPPAKSSGLCAAARKYLRRLRFHALRCCDDEKRASQAESARETIVRKIHVAGVS